MKQDPTPPVQAAKFWNRIAAKYARDPVADEASYQYKLDRTASYLTPDMSVLEVGCGTGTTALIHAPRVASILATDFSSAMIDIARQKAKDAGTTNATFQVSSVEDLPDSDQPYNLIMAHSFLQLVDDLDAVLAKIRSQLAPGGLFVSSTVCIRDMNPFLPLVLPILGWTRLIPKVRSMRGNDVASRIENAGFEIIENWRPNKKGSIFIVAKAI